VRSAPCTSKCHKTGLGKTHCDGQGACIADNPKACKGYCASDGHILSGSACGNLDLLFPIKPYFQQGSDAQDDDWAWQNNSASSCFANSCYRAVLQVTLENEHDDDLGFFDTYAASVTTCDDLIDTTLVPASCITSWMITLDDSTFSDYFKFKTGEDDDYVGRACFFRYACSSVNQSAFYDEAIFKRRSAPVASALVTPPRELLQRALSGGNLHGPGAAYWMHTQLAKKAQLLAQKRSLQPERRVFIV